MKTNVVENTDLLRSALAGLRAVPKTLNSKWFYDDAGSALFEKITKLPEYYPTRTELSILSQQTSKLGTFIPPGAALVELGSGASLKTRLLLDAFTHLGAYVPIDISAGFLDHTADELRRVYPDLAIHPVAGDFMQQIALPDVVSEMPKALFFPGSTIGNLPPPDAVALLQRMRGLANTRAFILGVDLVKERDVLIGAYDDAQGVTAAFNLNLLHRLNREVGATFEPNHFRHEARWNASLARIEMHLVSTVDQVVHVGPEDIAFAAGESIHTENSHKYTPDTIAAIATQAGWGIAEILTDPHANFAVCVLTPQG